MKSLKASLCFAAMLGLGMCAAASAGTKVAVMETAFGNRCKVESIAMAREAGYAGVQIHTGELDKNGLLTIARPEMIQAFKDTSAKQGIEIVSLCAGSMNRCSSLDPEQRKAAVRIGTQSIEACKALDVPILLVPFFGKASFGDDPEHPRFEAAVALLRELLPVAEANGVILGIEGPSKQPAVDHLLAALDHPNVQVYYDTGNMLMQGEDVYAVLRHWGADKICEIHLKPFKSPQAVFGRGKTDLDALAAAIREIGYDGWLVFEAGPGKKMLGVPYARTNREGIHQLLEKSGR